MRDDECSDAKPSNPSSWEGQALEKNAVDMVVLMKVARKVSQGMLDTRVSGTRMVRHTGSD